MRGPGGGTTVAGPGGGDWIVYHARAATDPAQARTMRIDPLRFGDDGSVTVGGPTASRQWPAP